MLNKMIIGIKIRFVLLSLHRNNRIFNKFYVYFGCQYLLKYLK